MSAGRDASFRQIIREAIAAVGTDFRTAHEFENKVAKAALDQVHARGLAIHDPENCIRRPWQDREKPPRGDRTGQDAPEAIGREMTLDEQIAVGMVVVSDDVP